MSVWVHAHRTKQVSYSSPERILISLPPDCCITKTEFSPADIVSLEAANHHCLCVAFKIVKATKHVEEFRLDMLWLLL